MYICPFTMAHNLIYNGSSGPFCAILGFPKKTSRIGEAVVLYFWGFFPSKKQGPNSNQNKRRLDSRYVEDYSYRSQNLKDNAFKLKKLQQRCFLRLTLSRYFQICHLLARLPDLLGVFSEQVGYSIFFEIIYSKNRYFTSCEACVFMYIPYTPNSSAYNFLIRAQGFSSSVVNLDHCFWMRPWCKIQVATADGCQLLAFCVFSLGKYGWNMIFSYVSVSYHTPPKKKWLVFIPHFFSHVAPAKWWLDWESKFSRGYLKLQECRLWLYRGLGKQRIIIGHMKDKYHWPSDMWSGTQLEVSDTWS